MLEGVVGLYNIDLITRIVWVVQLDENYNSSALFQNIRLLHIRTGNRKVLGWETIELLGGRNFDLVAHFWLLSKTL